MRHTAVERKSIGRTDRHGHTYANQIRSLVDRVELTRQIKTTEGENPSDCIHTRVIGTDGHDCCLRHTQRDMQQLYLVSLELCCSEHG